MSEPRRWKDSVDAPIGMRELLGSASRSHALDEATFDRGAKRVARLSLAPAAVIATSFCAKLAAAGVLGLAAVGAVVAVEVFARDDAPPPSRVEASVTRHPAPSSLPAVAAQRPTPAEEPVAPDASQPQPQPQPQRSAAHAMSASDRAVTAESAAPPTATVEPAPTPWVPKAPPRPKSTLADELALLQRARDHLAVSPEAALAELARHRELYSTGALAAERDLMELDALRRTGRVEEARSRARAWLAREPRGMHAARVREILGKIE